MVCRKGSIKYLANGISAHKIHVSVSIKYTEAARYPCTSIKRRAVGRRRHHRCGVRLNIGKSAASSCAKQIFISTGINHAICLSPDTVGFQ